MNVKKISAFTDTTNIVDTFGNSQANMKEKRIMT